MLHSDEAACAIKWSDDGREVVILDPKKLERSMKKFKFRSEKWTSFQRSLSYFGFKKQKGSSIYTHELFQRDKPWVKIDRKPNAGNKGKRKRSSASTTSSGHKVKSVVHADVGACKRAKPMVVFDRSEVERGVFDNNDEQLNDPTFVEYLLEKKLFWRVWNRKTYRM